MKNHSTVLLGIFLFVIPIHLLAQELPEYFPKTPEASAMDKFVDIPPGNYTGVAGYSIPLYTIEVDGYSIPITLNYHGMGIKVNEVASSVGLGWVLSIGGISLSREVVGEDDQVTTQLDIDVMTFAPQYGEPDYLQATNMARVDLSPDETTISELQPDYYSYSLLNNSGKFIIDNSGDGQTIPKDDVQIIGDTRLIDNKGIEYFFASQYENLSVTGSSGSLSANQIPSYRLDQIKLPSGRTINFTYINSEHSYIANHNEIRQVSQDAPNGDCPTIQNSVSRTIYNMNEKVLSQISYDNAKVDFVYDTQARADIGGKQLKNIQVKSLVGTTEQMIKDYSFICSYFQSPNPNDPTINSSNAFYDGVVKRLRLDELKETISQKSHVFEYYDTYDLPYRLSKDTDFWGLYNGKNNPSYIQQYTYQDNNNELRVEEGADKTPVLEYAQTASLRKIHLPTKGTQEFEYELDDYKYDSTQNLFFKRNYTVNATSSMFNQSLPFNIGGLDYRDGFDYRLEFYWSDNPLNESNINDLPIGSYCYLELLDQYGNVVQTLYHNMEIDISSLSQNNTYSFRFMRSHPSVPSSSASVWAKLTWYQNNVQYLANKNAGNLRISSITLRDSDNTIALKRNYFYKRPSEPQFSSGVFREFPKSYITESPGGTNGNFCTYENYSNNYDVNTSTFKGKSVVYEYVKEEYVNPDSPIDDHHTLKQFTLPTFQGQPQPNLLPKLPLVDYSYTGGLLLNSKAVDSNNEKLSETINVYDFDNHFNADSYNSQLGGVPSYALSSGVVIKLKTDYTAGRGRILSYNWNYYYIPSTWVKLSESTTKDYFNNGTSVIETKTTYNYEPNYKHIRPISETIHTSLGDEIRTEYKYPQELLGVEPHALDLVNANRIATPLVTSSLKKANNTWVTLSKSETEYEVWPNTVLEPQYIKTGKGNSTNAPIMEQRIIFSKYDDYGNPVELKKADGATIAYIWGYNSTLPVAKIENATYAQVQSQVANIQNKSNYDDDNCMDSSSCDEKNLRTALNALRSSLPNAMVTTYTYNPLIGTTSMTDPSGYTIYYEYDSANRLKRVKDANGKIISENGYNYRNQQ